MADFRRYARSATDPGFSARVVVPDDETDLESVSRGLYVGMFGHLRVLLVDDTEPVMFVNLEGGTYLPVYAKRVFATGTTASAIVAVS